MSFGLRHLERQAKLADQLHIPNTVVEHEEHNLTACGVERHSDRPDKMADSVLDSRHNLQNRSSPNLSNPHTDHDPSDAHWYYLLSKPASYCHHMSAPENLQSLRHIQNTRGPNVIENRGLHQVDCRTKSSSSSCDSASTVSSLPVDGNRHLLTSRISRFTIPPSDEGYGFTLQERPTGWYCSSSGQDSNNNRNYFSIYIHRVKRGSPADQVGLPVGARLLEVGGKLLDGFATLKDVVSQLRDAAKDDPTDAINVGVLQLNKLTHVGHHNFVEASCPSEGGMYTCTSPTDAFLMAPAVHGSGVTADGPNQTHTTQSSSPPWFSHATQSTHAQLTSQGNLRLNTVANWDKNAAFFLARCGPAVVCEERCVDVEPTDEDNLPSRSGDSSRRRQRFFKLAHPVLNLKWSELSPEEAQRQWAISDFLKRLDRISNEMLSGLRTYHLELRRVVNLDNEELSMLFCNITEIASQTWRLSQNLFESCLPYTRSDDMEISGPFHRKPTGPRTFGSYNGQLNSGVGRNVENDAFNRKPSLLQRIRKSFVGSLSRKEKLPTKPAGSHSIGSTMANRDAGIANEYEQDSRVRFSPEHGHLDNPGGLVFTSLPLLLKSCASYSASYLTTLRYVHDMKKRHPDLRTYLRLQSMKPEVPTLLNFLSTPQELQRCLLFELQKVRKHTVSQHKDRTFLDECILLLNEAMLGDPGDRIATPETLRRRPEGSEVPDHTVATRQNGFHRGDMDHSPEWTSSQSPTGGSHTVCNTSLGICSQFLSGGDKELHQLIHLARPPAFNLDSPSQLSCAQESGLICDQCIIFRGPLNCALGQQINEQDKSGSQFQELYRGQVFMYLLTNTLLVVQSAEDLLISRTPSQLLCGPVSLSEIRSMEFSLDMRFDIEMMSSVRFSFCCLRAEDQIVWKALLRQRIPTAQYTCAARL
ncbi:unnamed protein product [Dicrocoelium dendriticum]|nr:unnamed protein product [Dicrocoelium dendriticum]